MDWTDAKMLGKTHERMGSIITTYILLPLKEADNKLKYKHLSFPQK